MTGNQRKQRRIKRRRRSSTRRERERERGGEGGRSSGKPPCVCVCMKLPRSSLVSMTTTISHPKPLFCFVTIAAECDDILTVATVTGNRVTLCPSITCRKIRCV
ncbi:uncharacterized [Lates japonicus]